MNYVNYYYYLLKLEFIEINRMYFYFQFERLEYDCMFASFLPHVAFTIAGPSETITPQGGWVFLPQNLTAIVFFYPFSIV